MAGIRATIDALHKLLKEEAGDVDSIASVKIEMSVKHGGWKAERPFEFIGAQMNGTLLIILRWFC